MTQHLTDRLTQRLQGVVENPGHIVDMAQRYAYKTGLMKAVAMLVARLPKKEGASKASDANYRPGQYAGRPSNGDEVWIVSRHGRLVTVMFRRADQPKRSEAFDVNEVVDLTTVLPTLLHAKTELQFRARRAG